MSTPSAKALSTLRAKHLTALEQITSLTQQLARVTQQNNNTDGITAALKKGQATWDLDKDKLNQALSSLNERLQHSNDKTLALTATNAELHQQANEWKTQCTLIQERINTQKWAFITATDSVALL
jgi:chromosome segregation ATPase